MAKVQFSIMAGFAFLIATFSLVAPMAMTPMLIITALYPAYIFLKNGQLKASLLESKTNQLLTIALLYALISALWAIDPGETLYLWLRVALIFVGYMALLAYTAGELKAREKLLQSLFFGMLIALILVNIEIFTNGAIYRFFGPVFKGNNQFEMTIFNRGASILGILSWPVVSYLCATGRYKTAIGFVLAVLFTIIRLESLSSMVGLALGAGIFTLVYFTGNKTLKSLAVLAACGVFIVAFAAKTMDAREMVGNVPEIPGAASNFRLYIWDYTAEQAYKKPLLGWGFNSSRSYPIEEKDYLSGGRSPLPLHPHNNVLQVWLELGAVGLVLFAGFLFFTLRQISAIKAPPYVMAASTALFANYFIIGEVGYGIWQNWWVCAGVLAVFFLQLAKKPLV